MAALSHHLSHEVDQKQTSDKKLLAIFAGDKPELHGPRFCPEFLNTLCSVLSAAPWRITELTSHNTLGPGLHCSANLIQFLSLLFLTGISLESWWQGAGNTRLWLVSSHQTRLWLAASVLHDIRMSHKIKLVARNGGTQTQHLQSWCS